MGLQIGQNPASLAAVRQPRPREPEPVRAAPDAPQSAPSNRAAVDTETVSGPAAALVTIDRTVRGVREFTPTLQETSVELRERLAERRVESQRRAEEIGRRIETRIPEPSVQVRNFINQANETAGLVEARTGGEEALQLEGPSLEADGERVPVEPAQAEPRAPVDREPELPPRIDIRV